MKCPKSASNSSSSPGFRPLSFTRPPLNGLVREGNTGKLFRTGRPSFAICLEARARHTSRPGRAPLLDPQTLTRTATCSFRVGRRVCALFASDFIFPLRSVESDHLLPALESSQRSCLLPRPSTSVSSVVKRSLLVRPAVGREIDYSCRRFTVSGANRPNGLGFHLARQLAQLPNSLVFAAVRNPASANQLAALASERENVIVVKLDVTSEADAPEAAQMVKERAGKVDVLIPCAGSPSFTFLEY